MRFNYPKHMISLAVVCMTLLFITSSLPQPKPVYALQISGQYAIKLLASSSGSSPFFLPPLSSSQSNSTNSTTTIASSSNFLTYQNSTYGISVQHPSNWIMVENHNTTAPDRIVKFSSPQGTPPATLNILGGNRLPLNMSLEQFSAASINNLRQSLPRFNLLESSSTTLGGFPAHRVIYTAEVAPGFGAKFMQVWTINNARDFIITDASLPSDFSTYLPTMQHMINSFAFIPTTSTTQPANNATTSATQPANNATTSANNQTGPPSVVNRTAYSSPSNQTSLSSILPFMNNIFNGSSLSGIVGISSVNGVKVTGVNLGSNDISVTLGSLTTGINNVSSVPPSVTVTVIRLPMSLKDLMSLAAASGSMGGNNTSMMTANNANPLNALIGQGSGGVGANATIHNNPLEAFLKNIQIGSSSILNADWRLPQTTTMGLIGATNGSSANSTADFVIVTVVPYTGKTDNLTG
jgi:hypothetical protein